MFLSFMSYKMLITLLPLRNLACFLLYHYLCLFPFVDLSCFICLFFFSFTLSCEFVIGCEKVSCSPVRRRSDTHPSPLASAPLPYEKALYQCSPVLVPCQKPNASLLLWLRTIKLSDIYISV